MKRTEPIALLIMVLLGCADYSAVESSNQKPLYAVPKRVLLDTTSGYLFNTVTGDSIKPIINSLGQETITGKPILFKGKEVLESEVSKSQVVPAGKPIVTQTKSRQGDQLTPVTIKVDESKLKKVRLGHGDQDFVLINSYGDTVPTGVPIPAIGTVTKVIEKVPTRALPPRMKDHSIFDIQFLDKEQGMSGSSIHCVLFDSRGSLWLGTRYGGISRYDGRNFYHYSSEEGFPFKGINSIMEDSKQRIWFATVSGLVCYNGSEFISFSENNGLGNAHIWSISEDSNGNLWLVTLNGGVVKFDEKSFVHYTKKEGLPSNSIYKVLEDNKGSLWFTGINDITKFDGDSFMLFGEEFGLSDPQYGNTFFFRTISKDENGDLWIIGSTRGVIRYKIPDVGTVAELTFFGNENSMSWNSNSLLRTKDGRIWFNSFSDGVLSFNPDLEENGIISIDHLSVHEGMPHYEIWGVAEFGQNKLTFGSDGGGAIFFDPKSFIDLSALEGLKTNEIRAVVEDGDGNIWLGTDGRGITRFNPETQTFDQFTDKQGLSGNDIWSLYIDSTGDLWIGTWLEGVSKYDGKTFTHFSPNQGIPGHVISVIYEDHAGNMWFGGLDKRGLVRYGPSKNSEGIKSFTHFTDQEGLLSSSVYSLLEDKKGNFWIGTDYGISKWDGSYLTHYSEKEGLAGKQVNAIFEDNSGNIWIGTDQGLDKFDGASFTHYNERTGLSNNNITSIVEDKWGNLWVGTSNGLNKMAFGAMKLNQPESEKGTQFSNAVPVYVFSYMDGLKETNFYRNAALIDNKNRAWWGTEKNLVMLDLENYSTASEAPVVRLTQIDVDNQFIDYRNIEKSLVSSISFTGVEKFGNIPQDLELNYKANHLAFYFVGIDWAAPQKIKYSYKLEGLGDAWSTPSSDIKAEYRNLSHGDYTFLVRAIGESLEWSQPLSYSFTIHPPWWHTWWAYLLYSLAFGGAVWLVHLYQKEKVVRIERQRAQIKELEQAKQIEKAYIDLKSTQAQLIQSEKMASLGELTAGIAHEIQNPLNFVNNFSEVSAELVEEMKDSRRKTQETRPKTEADEIEDEILEDIKENLEKIKHHGKRADAIVKGMLEHSRKSTGEKVPTDLNALAEEYLKLSYHGMRAKDKSFTCDFQTDLDPNLPKIKVIPQDIGRVLLNIINNAFQAVGTGHALSLQPLVTVSTKNLGDKIEISIKDNGPGIPDSIKEKIFQPFFTTKPTGQGTGLGLSLAYDIVKAHGGQIEVKSTPGEFTAFTVFLPI